MPRAGIWRFARRDDRGGGADSASPRRALECVHEGHRRSSPIRCALARSFAGPIEIVQGTTDLQTNIADAQAIQSARPGITLRLIDGMNHVLKVATSDRQENFGTYANPDLPLAPGVVDAIAGFMLSH